jgi:hypothetical protein
LALLVEKFHGANGTRTLRRSRSSDNEAMGRFFRTLNYAQTLAMVVAAFGLPIRTAHGNEGKLYWTDAWERKIYRADLDGRNIEALIAIDTPAGVAHTKDAIPTSITLDTIHSRLYWTEGFGPAERWEADPRFLFSKAKIVADGRIRRARLDGGCVEEILSGLQAPQGLAIDEVHGKLYWVEVRDIVDSSLRYMIRRANIDGTCVEDLPIPPSTNFPAIALDAEQGLLYRTSAPYLLRSVLDGTKREWPLYVPPTMMWPYSPNSCGISLDLENETAYWDAGTGVIKRTNIESLNTTNLLEGHVCATMALDARGRMLYWIESDAIPIQIWCAPIDGGPVRDFNLAMGTEPPIAGRHARRIRGLAIDNFKPAMTRRGNASNSGTSIWILITATLGFGIIWGFLAIRGQIVKRGKILLRERRRFLGRCWMAACCFTLFLWYVSVLNGEPFLLYWGGDHHFVTLRNGALSVETMKAAREYPTGFGWRPDPFKTRASGVAGAWDAFGFTLPIWRTSMYGRWILVPLWAPFVGLLLFAAVVFWRNRRRPAPGHCHRCGYNLTGNVSGICPECGLVLGVG